LELSCASNTGAATTMLVGGVEAGGIASREGSLKRKG